MCLVLLCPVRLSHISCGSMHSYLLIYLLTIIHPFMDNFSSFLTSGIFHLADVASTEKFRQSEGPKIVMDLLKGGSENSDLLDAGFSVVAAGSAGNEVVKESFMDLKVDELILQVMKDKSKANVQSLYDAIRVLLTPDDNRVVASQVCPIFTVLMFHIASCTSFMLICNMRWFVEVPGSAFVM